MVGTDGRKEIMKRRKALYISSDYTRRYRDIEKFS